MVVSRVQNSVKFPESGEQNTLVPRVCSPIPVAGATCVALLGTTTTFTNLAVVINIVIKIADIEEEGPSLMILYDWKRAFLNEASQFPVDHREIGGRLLVRMRRLCIVAVAVIMVPRR